MIRPNRRRNSTFQSAYNNVWLNLRSRNRPVGRSGKKAEGAIVDVFQSHYKLGSPQAFGASTLEEPTLRFSDFNISLSNLDLQGIISLECCKDYTRRDVTSTEESLRLIRSG